MIAALRRAGNERWPYLAVLLGVVCLDRASKWLVDRTLTLHESHPVIEGWLSLTYVRNRGAVFGILSQADLPFQPALLAVVGILALGAIVAYSASLPIARRLPQTGLALVTGGAIGNLLDRAAFGYVIDFVDVFWGRHHWPAFNLADSAISVGVGLLLLDLFRGSDPTTAGDAAVSEATPTGRSD